MGRGTPTTSAAGLNLVALVWLSVLVVSSAQRLNITGALASYPTLSVLSDLLVSSGVENEINAQTSVTLLAPSNGVLQAFTARFPNADSVKIADLLRLHVLLQYFSVAELKGLGTENYTSVTTLLQTTGRAGERTGFINIFNSADQILISPDVSDSDTNATVVGTVLEDPYDLSIIEIDKVLLPAGFNGSQDLIEVLDSFQTFSLFISYLKATGVDAIFASRQASGGLTVFAPTDSAFNALKSGSISTLTINQQKLLMQYHALTSYYKITNLQTMNNTPVQTLTGTIGGGYRMNITATGATVVIKTGVGNATLTKTLYDANPASMFATDKVLLPTELFGTLDELSPAEAPTPDTAPAPSPKKAPTAAPKTTPSAAPEAEILAPPIEPSSASVDSFMGALSALLLVVSSMVAFV